MYNDYLVTVTCHVWLQAMKKYKKANFLGAGFSNWTQNGMRCFVRLSVTEEYIPWAAGVQLSISNELWECVQSSHSKIHFHMKTLLFACCIKFCNKESSYWIFQIAWNLKHYENMRLKITLKSPTLKQHWNHSENPSKW